MKQILAPIFWAASKPLFFLLSGPVRASRILLIVLPFNTLRSFEHSSLGLYPSATGLVEESQYSGHASTPLSMTHCKLLSFKSP
jgi:hypothetical protein